jgi:hypothetical protein
MGFKELGFEPDHDHTKYQQSNTGIEIDWIGQCFGQTVSSKQNQCNQYKKKTDDKTELIESFQHGVVFLKENDVQGDGDDEQHNTQRAGTQVPFLFVSIHLLRQRIYQSPQLYIRLGFGKQADNNGSEEIGNPGK